MKQTSLFFVVDGLSGLTDSDYYIAKLLYKTDKPVIVAVNKIDDISIYKPSSVTL